MAELTPNTNTAALIAEVRERVKRDDRFRLDVRNPDSRKRIQDVYGELDHRLLVSMNERAALCDALERSEARVERLEQERDDVMADFQETAMLLREAQAEIGSLKFRVAGDRVPDRGFVTRVSMVAFCGRCRNTQIIDPAHTNRARTWLAEHGWTVTDDDAICDECSETAEQACRGAKC